MARLATADLKDVREAVFDSQNSWYDIGVELDVSPATLDNIKTQFHDDADCLREMLKVWLKGLDCSWKVIVAALKSKALRQKTGTLAAEIEKEYCTETATKKRALNATDDTQEDMVSVLQTKVRKLESEVSALKTQQKLDQGDFSSVTESTSKSGIDVFAKGRFVVTNNKAHVFEMKRFGLRLHIPEGALPPGVDETTVHVEVSLSGQYCISDNSELASVVYWLSSPVKFSRPVGVEIQHNAAFEDPNSKLCFTICRYPEGKQPQLPYTFEKLEGGVFSRSSRNGIVDVSGFSGLAIIMPKGGPQYYLGQLWYAKKSEDDWRIYYVITKDLAALESAVEACYSDEGFKGCCARVDFEGDQIMMDIPMEGIRIKEWKVTPLYHPVISKEDANSFHCERLPVCEFDVKWADEPQQRLDSFVPAELSCSINLLGAKAPGYVMLDIKTSYFDEKVYVLKVFYSFIDDFTCDVHLTITAKRNTYDDELWAKMNAVKGPEMSVVFEAPEISMEIPADVSAGWKIMPLTKLQISEAEVKRSHVVIPCCELRITRDSDKQKPLILKVPLKGAVLPNIIELVLNFREIRKIRGTRYPTHQNPSLRGRHSTVPGHLKTGIHYPTHPTLRGRHYVPFSTMQGPVGSLAEGETELSRIKSATEMLIGIIESTSYPSGHQHLPHSTELFIEKYKDGVQSAPELPDLMNEVAAEIPQKWHEVGIQLGMDYDQLQFLSNSNPPGSQQFASVFTAWKNCMKKDYTWAVLIQALESPAVNEPQLAQELSSKLTV